jgi:hypothetical protein
MPLRINTFLDRVNEEFFQPRGLFCLIVTWRPDVNKTHETVNIEDPLYSSSTRSLPFPKTAQLTFPLGDPTENMEPSRDLSGPNNMYDATSPVYGRGAGIPRLAGADPYGYYDPYGYGGMDMYDQGYGMGMGRMGGMGMGGMGMGMGGMGMGRTGGFGGGMGMGRMGGFGGMGGMGGTGGMGGMGMGGGMGGPLGLIAGYIENKMIGKSQSNQGYQGAGYDPGYSNANMARGPPSKGSDIKAFKKVTPINSCEMNRTTDVVKLGRYILDDCQLTI